MNKKVRIYPSLMAADPLYIGQAIKELDDHVDGWHLDIMDGHFVPNVTYGPAWIKSVIQNTKKPIDVHLMVEPVEPWCEWLPQGITSVTFHPEATKHPHRVLEAFKKRGFQAGLAISPGTSLDVISPLACIVDLALILGVNPGWSGQSFISTTPQKIKEARKRFEGLSIIADGGINHDTAHLCTDADIWVTGSAVFDKPDKLKALRDLRSICEA